MIKQDGLNSKEEKKVLLSNRKVHVSGGEEYLLLRH